MPIDRGSIDAQLRDIGEGDRWWEQREFRDLPYVLQPDERILALANGRVLLRRRPRLRSGPPWLVVITSQRLICLRQERFARRQVEYAWDQVTGLDHRSRLRSYEIRVTTPTGRVRVRIAPGDAFRFLGALAPLAPQGAGPRRPVDLEPLAWIPGIATVAELPVLRGIVSRVAILSPPDYASRAQVERLEATVAQLQQEVGYLQQNVAFLEELLEQRAAQRSLQAMGTEL